ncbi:transglycosylase domain-containing protein [Mameliella sediminis]|uniref:transglycosylase domain-containing protein n=1 Tax=Mameliella sediminis TaxID=2836866 RepID=UPI001C47E9CA|nr:PBP1A family penicillin-binding protein [Mameliella sediminis]MBY6113131.1 PBP1A family penicillin-binding protein [Antarctobacter heliothermus]MBY6143521.1 PBP1A family penicillin-binding protein [Mameliella alba]MBV7394414.1 PBP1A family penicillin-binding protein [Mameliella sediminis]MBY6162601.1 PBP1A family penicillin-binding protein [Mameliella alba]MBY6171960.1 PBP1A family penicillin-binding protein [Mameliella alba]
MSSSKGKSSRLVADRRYPRGKAKPAAKGTKTRKTTTRRKPARRQRRGGILGFFGAILRWIVRLIWRVTLSATVVTALIVGAAVLYVYSSLPEMAAVVDGRARGSVTLLDRNGEVFALRGDQFGGAVTADTVSEHLKNAVVATEDRRFYWHFGVSPRGVASAIRINLREGRGPLSGHGGSTITQQTAKLLCLGVEYDPEQWKSEADYVSECRRSSLTRKAHEAIYAMAMEAKYTKAEILSIYLNRAYMGGGAYGAEAASQRYFAKHAAALNPAEAAMLAGLLTAPSTLAPTSNLSRSQDRAATVLRLMYDQGYLTEEEMRHYQANPATLAQGANSLGGGYFADWIMSSDMDYLIGDTTEDIIIETTLDQRMQTATARAVDKIFSEKVKPGSKAQVAVVVMSADGAVRAMVGGRDTDATGLFNRATQAVRQTGSAFKPFVYATALELGYSPLDTVVDAPYCLNIPGSGQWCPENYSRRHYGTVTLVEALKKSLNIPAVKVSEAVGRDLVLRVARDFGIYRDLTDTPSLALGAAEATLLEMTGAYAGILNGGSSVKPYGQQLIRYKGSSDPLMQASGGMGERVVREDAARQLVWMMQKVVSEGTGGRAALPDRQVAGKTGTSQEARDAWFVGFTADYVAGVWMGYDDNTPLTGVTGSGLPAEIWHEVMLRVHEGLPVRSLPMTEPVPPKIIEPEPAPQQPRRRETILEQVLRDILGGGN